MRKMSKKLLGLLTIATIGLSANETFASSNLSLIINGGLVNASPMIQTGRTLVPIRIIGEELGSNVHDDSQTKGITITKNGMNMKLTLNQTNTTVNGVSKPLDVPARAVNGVTYVPIRFISESFGINVDYNGVSKQVFVGNNNSTSSGLKLSFNAWDDAMEKKFGDDWDDDYEDLLERTYGERALDLKYGDNWDDNLEYALYRSLNGTIPNSLPTTVPSTLIPLPSISTSTTLSFDRWEDLMEDKFGDDWDDDIEDIIERKYGEKYMEYHYGDDWDDDLEYAFYLYYDKKIPTTLYKDIPSTLKKIR